MPCLELVGRFIEKLRLILLSEQVSEMAKCINLVMVGFEAGAEISAAVRFTIDAVFSQDAVLEAGGAEIHC